MQTRIQELQSIIAEADKAYYQKNKPTLTDYQYDMLKKELERMAPELVQSVGNDLLPHFKKFTHTVSMLSLENSYTPADVITFLATTQKAGAKLYTVEPKVDGLSLSVWYEKGILVRAVTRGNGVEGDIVTESILRTTKLPLHIVYEDTIEFRGEAYMLFSEFERINRERAVSGEELFANPRNLASGTLKSLTKSEQI